MGGGGLGVVGGQGVVGGSGVVGVRGDRGIGVGVSRARVKGWWGSGVVRI